MAARDWLALRALPVGTWVEVADRGLHAEKYLEGRVVAAVRGGADQRGGDGGAALAYDVNCDDGSTRRGVASGDVEPLLLVRYEGSHAQDVLSPRAILTKATRADAPPPASEALDAPPLDAQDPAPQEGVAE